MKKFLFKGTDTSGRIHYKAEGNTLLELYNDLERQNIITTSDYDPYEKAVMKKYNKTWDDFMDEDGYENHDLFVKWYDTVDGLTDNEILEMIGEENGNAYYQTIYKYNDETDEYDKLED